MNAARSIGGRARTSRRDAILEAATRLFAERGFAETGVDDIGEAVGITGPAVYRHFASKHDLLVAVIERSVRTHDETTARALAESRGPDDRLAKLVHFTADACIDDRALTAIYWQERRNLPPDARQEIDALHRRMMDEWAAALREVRPDLTGSEARMAVHAASALLQSVANRDTSLSRRALHELLEGMALAALLTPAPAQHDGEVAPRAAAGG
ncbi:MAG: TetR/AcrR family transcriptional regulator [Acidimicrobiia bacterium]|nr:TetR/AcrR family transcriptional regulator [Acidimicrobiia bacterium]